MIKLQHRWMLSGGFAYIDVNTHIPTRSKRKKNQQWKTFLILAAALALGGFALSTNKYVQAYREIRTAHIFATSVTAAGWSEPENAEPQELGWNAPFGAFKTSNSAYISIGVGSTTPETNAGVPAEFLQVPPTSAQTPAIELSQRATTTATTTATVSPPAQLPVATTTPIATTTDEGPPPDTSKDMSRMHPLPDLVELSKKAAQKNASSEMSSSTSLLIESNSSSTSQQATSTPSIGHATTSASSTQAFFDLRALTSALFKKFVATAYATSTDEATTTAPAQTLDPHDVATCKIVGNNCYTIELSGFAAPEPLSERKFQGAVLNLSLAMIAPERTDAEDKLQIRYFHDGKWRSAGEIFINKEISNASNGGYFTTKLDDIQSWKDLDDVKVMVEYVRQNESAPAQIFLDSAWIDTQFSERAQDVLSGQVLGASVNGDNVSLSLNGEATGGGALILDNGDRLLFPYIDNFNEDTLVIRGDKPTYKSGKDVVFTSITNTGASKDSFQLSVSFPGGRGSVSELSQYLHDVPEATSTAIINDVTYYCESGWAFNEKDGVHECAATGEKYLCAALNDDKQNCRVENVVVGHASTTIYRSEWVKTSTAQARIDQTVKRGLPPGYQIAASSQQSFEIMPGQTLYFRMRVDTPDTESQRFVLSAKGANFGDMESMRLKNESSWQLEQRSERILRKPQLNDQLSTKTDFTALERPDFHFHYKTQRGFFARLRDNIFGKDVRWQVKDVRLVHEDGQIEHADAEVIYGSNDEWTYDVSQVPRAFMPGKYTMEMDIQEGDEMHTDTMDFYWGVLAVNPDKATYAQGETAHLSIAALDDSGDVMCDAQLSLTITAPSGNATDVPVISGGGCGHNNVTDLPDYVADYMTHEEGNYTVTLTHLNDSGDIINSVTDSFVVDSASPFYITRQGPTRIYPASVYKMDLTIKARGAFKGTIREVLPEGFTVPTHDGATLSRKDGVIYLSWNVSMDAGETKNLPYWFKAPEVSPYLYQVGPLELKDTSGASIYKESRTWKIASDATAIATGVAWLQGTQTTDGASFFTELNNATARALAWSSGSWDDTYFATSSTASRLTVNVAGDYLVAVTLPVERTDNRLSDVTMLEADIRVNGTKIDQGVARTAYNEHRNAKTSSNHLYLLLHNLNAGDYIEAYSHAITAVSANDTIAIGSSASIYAEYIPTTETIFSAVGTTTSVSGDNLNSSATTSMKWYDASGRVDSNYTHSNASTTAQTITLASQADYFVAINIPDSGAITNARVRGRVLLGGTMINGGDFKQGYIGNTGNTASSLQWSGIVHATTTNSNLTVTTQTEAAAGTITVGSDKASIYVQKLPTSDIFFGRATTTTSTTDWNSAAAVSIKWGVHDLIDSSTYSIATGTSHQITVNKAGDYLLAFNDSLSGAVTYGDPKVQVQIGGVDRTGGQTKTNTVYNVGGDTQSSGSFVFLLRDLAVGNVISLTSIADAQAGAMTSDQNALLMLWHKAAQSSYIQATERWYANTTASTTPSDPWPTGAVDLNEGDPITSGNPIKSGDAVRLEMALKANVTTATSSDSFKLQYAAGSLCSPALTWNDVGAAGSGSIWRAHTNAGLTAGSTLSSTTLSVATKKETYEESNPSALDPQAIPAGSYGEWDWSLEDNSAPAGTDYCFRMVASSGQVLKDYTDYPALETNSTPIAPTLNTLFDNEKTASTTPWFTWSSSDPNGEDIDYQIQVSTVSDFTSTTIDQDTLTNFNNFDNVDTPSDSQPFNSGDTVRYKVLSGDTPLVNGTTYYWHVRGKDSSGTGSYGSWSSTYSFTVDTGVAVSTWFQTTKTQFNNDTLSSTEATTSPGDVGLSGSNAAGSVYSQAVSYSSHTTGNSWGGISWNNSTSSGTILYHVEYFSATSSWTIVPESDLPGNSAGTTTQPFNIAGLDPSTYSQLRIRADLTKVTGTPRLLDWTLSWALSVNQPSQSKPFDNEKTSTTTPDFRFTTTDPQSDNLVYQIQWSTDSTFASGVTTHTSDADAGFTNVTTPGNLSPFTSGSSINFHMQNADRLTNSTTYWWRVRAKDPGGGNAYSIWSPSHSFTTDTTVTQSTWFQTTTAQFNTDTLSNVTAVSNDLAITTDVGKIAVYRSATAGEAITTDTFTHGFDTTVSQGDIYSLDGTTTVLLKSGYYAAMYGARYDSTAGTRRSIIQSSLSVASTTLPIGWSTGYMSRANGDNAAYTAGGGIIAVTSDNTPLKVQSFRTDANAGATLTRTANTSGVQLIRLDPNWDYLRLSKTSTQTGPTSAGWTSVTYNSEDQVSSGSFSHSKGGSNITLKSAGHYLIFVNTYGSLSSGSTNETAVIQRLTLNGYDLPGSYTTVYMRGNTNSNAIYEGAASLGMIFQSTTTNQTLNVQLSRSLGSASWTIDANSAGTYVDRSGITIVKLPEANFIRLTDSGAGNINTAALSPFTWNTEDEKGNSWSHNVAVNSSRLVATTSGDYLVMTTLYAQDGGVADAAFNQGWTKNSGSLIQYGQTIGYGSLTTSELGNWSANIFPSLVANDYVEVVTQAVGNAGTVSADNKEVEGLRIGSLSEANTTPLTVESTAINFTDGDGPKWGTATSSDAHPGSSAIKYQLEYFTSTSSWNIVPGSALTGNDTAAGLSLPVDLSSLSRTTYSSLKWLATFSCAGGNCPTVHDWTLTWSLGNSISGTIKKADQSTNVAGGTIAVAVNGNFQNYKNAVISNGTWTISNVTMFAGDVITVFVQGASTSTRAAGITKYRGSGDVSGMNLYEGSLTLGSYDNPTITNTDIGQYDNSVANDAALFYNTDAGNDLTVCSLTDCANFKLIVGTSTLFRPDSASSGDVTTPGVQIDGTWVADNNTVNVSRSWKNNASFIKGASTVNFTATSTTETINSSYGTTTAFYAVTFGSGSGSATWNLQSPIYASSTLSVNFGTLAQGATSTINLDGDLTFGASGLFAKNQATTTFIGSATSTWSDSTAGKQDLGRVVVGGAAGKVLLLGSDVRATDLTINTGNIFDANNSSNYSIMLYGNWTNNDTFRARNGSVYFTATTTNRTITAGSSAFYNINFNGTTQWSFTEANITVNNNFFIVNGTTTLPTATTTITGSFDASTTNSGFQNNNGGVLFNASSAQTINVGKVVTNVFRDVTFNGSGSWSFTAVNATTTRNLIIQTGTVTAPSGNLAVGGNFLNTGGTFTHNTGTLKLTSTSAQSLQLGGSDAYNITFDGVGGLWTMLDTNATSTATVRFTNGTSTLPSGIFAVGGSWIATAGGFTHNSGTVKFNATTTGFSITPLSSKFANLLFDATAGGWTITGNATSTATTTLSHASSFTLTSGKTLEVDGGFSNAVASSSQTWTGSTLYLNSGTSYTINTKTTGGATYGTIMLGANTNVRDWASFQATTTVASSASLYAQNYASSTGSLYIWGAFSTSNDEYWSYANDFDGTVLSGASRRAVTVKVASSSSLIFAPLSSTKTLKILGDPAASTTIQNQGAGTFSLLVKGGTLNAQYYVVASTSAMGLGISSTTVITSLGYGEYKITYLGGSAISASSTVIDSNPQLQIFNVKFATTSVLSNTTYNVTETGTPTDSTNFWWFKNGSGNMYGEAFDNDPGPNGGNPGYIQFDDSGFTVTISGHVYSDHGFNALGSPTCDGATAYVVIRTDIGQSYSGSCAVGTGAYNIPNVTFRNGAVLTAYLNTGAGGAHAATVTHNASADISGFDLYQNALIVRHADATPLANTDLAANDSNFDANNLRFTVSGSDLTVKPDTELFVWANRTFSPGGNVTLQSGGSGLATDGRFWMANNSTTTMSGSNTLSIGGGMYMGTTSVFTGANSTVTFTATTSGKSLYLAASTTFYNMTFNGSGGQWSFDSISGAATTTVSNTFTFTAGTIIGRGDLLLATGGLTGSGTFTMTGGTVQLQGTGSFGNGNLWQFKNLVFGDGTNAASSTKTGSATTTITGQLTLQSSFTQNAGNTGAWVFTGSGTGSASRPFVNNGTHNAMSAPYFFYGTSDTDIQNANYNQLFLAPSGAGSPTYNLGGGTPAFGAITIGDGTNPVTVTADTNDPSITVSRDVRINPSATLIASNTGEIDVGGSWSNAGTFTPSGQLVLFNAGSTGKTIDAGASPFYDVTFNNSSGGWTIMQNATTTHNFTITNTSPSAGIFVLSSGKTLEVDGTFTNSVGGSPTTWTGSTLYLNSGTSYSLNTKTTGSDSYGTLSVGASTKIAMWNSSSTAVTMNTTGSLYSQNHANVSGALNIWGAYTRSSGSDYWSYATDFDGTDISATPRAVSVLIASSSSVVFSGGTFDIIGSGAATSTIGAIGGTGAYSFMVSGGTFTANYYQFRNLDLTYGLNIIGSPTISSLSFGDFGLVASGTAMTVAGSVIDNNQQKVIKNVKFATTTQTAATNVTATSSTSSYWKFNLHYGNLAGERFDNDAGGDPGYIRWDDSNIAITIEGKVYSDEGSTVSSGCDNSTQFVKLKVEGAGSYTASCASADGKYTIPGVSYNPGDVFTVYLSTTTAKSATVTRGLSASSTNMDVYEHRVIVRTDDATPLNIADMDQWDNGNDSLVPFTATVGGTNTLTVVPNTKLIVWTGKTFAPAGNVTLQSGGSGQIYDGSLEIYAGGTFTAAGSQSHSVGGNFIVRDGGTYTPANSTVTFTATTTGKTITTATSTFYNVTFNGGNGNWAFSAPATTTNDFSVSKGTVTLPSGTLYVGGNFNNSGGNGGFFMHNNGTVVLNSTASGKSIWTATSTLYNLTANGSGGAWTWQEQNATTTNNLTITLGTLTLPTSTLAVGANFSNAGTFTSGIGTVKFTSTASGKTITAGGSDFNGINFDGVGGTWTFQDLNATSTSDFTITNGSTTLPSISMGIGGSFTNLSSFWNNGGIVRFTASAVGKTVAASSSPFYDVTFDNSNGGWTLTGSATSTHNATLNAASSFTLSSGKTLAVGGTFTNNVGGSWSGSMLYLYSGTTYSINTRTAPAANYATLTQTANTNISMWNSSVTTANINPASYLYSQDNGNVDGSLYIYGAYTKSTGIDYWSDATDFDGTNISGTPRQVAVRIATSSSVSYSGATLNMVGISTASTTVRTTGSPGTTYSFSVAGGTLNASYYDFRNMDSTGVSISGSPTISSMGNGYFEISVASGTAITLASTVVDTNGALTNATIGFATTSANLRGYNVTLTGSAGSFWTFAGAYGNFAGEAHDNDGSTACGHIRWDDSNCQIISESHYRWRNDDGGEGAPNSEWYNASWTKRQRIAISNPNGTAYTDLPVKIDVPYDTDMLASFDDLRFTDSGGTSTIKFWREKNTSSTSTVWVKIASLPASGSAIIYMYYGNAGAAAADDATTFSFLDDFEDNNITEYSGDSSNFSASGSFNYGRGLYGLSGTNVQTDPGIYQSGSQTAQGKTIRWWQYVDATQSIEMCTFFGLESVSPNRDYGVCVDRNPIGSNGERLSIARDVRSRDLSGTTMASTSASYSTGWYEVVVDWLTSGAINVNMYDSTGALFKSVSTTTSSSNPTYHTSGGIGFGHFNSQNSGWDDLMVKQYTASAPTSIFGKEQTSGGASWQAAEDTAILTLLSNQNVRLRFSLQNSGSPRNSRTYKLQYSDIGAAVSCEAVSTDNYVAVPVAASCGASPVCMSSSSQFSDQASTTPLLSYPASMAFTYGKMVQNASNQTNTLNIASTTATEVEYNFKMTNAASANTYCFRVNEDGLDLDSYDIIAKGTMIHPPFITNLSLNNAQDITLTEGATTTVYVTATTTDYNGYTDMVQGTSTVFRNGVSGGASCTADNNNCYQIPSSSCTFSDCSGNTCTLSCSADIYYFADPTDTYGGYATTTYYGQGGWRASMAVQDASGYRDTQTTAASTTQLNTLRALSVTTGGINYGSLNPASDTGAVNSTSTIRNTGNVNIDITVAGSSTLASGLNSIPVGQQKYATSTFVYGSCAICAALTGTATNIDVSVVKATSTSPNQLQNSNVFWGISVPNGTPAGVYMGTTTFIAVGG